MTYRSRYRTQVQIQPTLELLLQDESNPRALSYQLKHIHDDIRDLPRQDQALGYKIPEQRLALEALSQVRLADTAELIQIDDNLRPHLNQLLMRLSRLAAATVECAQQQLFQSCRTAPAVDTLRCRGSAMKYRVTHKTTYTYSNFVSQCHNEAYLLPRNSAVQHCRRAQLSITPAPARLDEWSDFFGNRTHYFSIQTPHRVLTVTALSEMDISASRQSAVAGLCPPLGKVFAMR